jgi:U6 snRNA-associated Sm-like protein LSm3
MLRIPTDRGMLLKAYDSHCNLVLGDVEETIYVVEEDDNEEETVRVGNPWIWQFTWITG